MEQTGGALYRFQPLNSMAKPEHRPYRRFWRRAQGIARLKTLMPKPLNPEPVNGYDIWNSIMKQEMIFLQ